MQRNVIHEDSRTKRLKSMMREIADAQRAANELQAHVSAAESQAAKNGYGKEPHIGEDGDIFFDISPPAKQSDKTIALALPKDSTPALREAVKAYVIASGKLTSELYENVFEVAATGVGITPPAAGSIDITSACQQGRIPMNGSDKNSTRRAAGNITTSSQRCGNRR